MKNRAVNRLRIETLNFGQVSITETPNHSRIIKCINDLPVARLLDCTKEHQLWLKDEWYTVVAYDVTFDVEARLGQKQMADLLWENMMAIGVDDSVSTEWIVPHKGIHKITY